MECVSRTLHAPTVTSTLTIADEPLAPLLNVIAFVFCPDVSVPLTTFQSYVAPACASTFAWRPVAPREATLGATIAATGCAASVTMWLTVVAHPPAFVTVTLHVFEASVCETLIDELVEPFDQR
jgi:hypothetical protein